MSTPQSLRDEIALREASIRDAREEFEAGELTSDQLNALVQREQAALDQLTAKLTEAESAPTSVPAPRTPRRRRKSLLVVAIVCFVLAAAASIVFALAPRQPGNSDTGSVAGTTSQKVAAYLAEAEADQGLGDTTSALSAYRNALALDANNVEALTQTGWLEFSAGSAARDVQAVANGLSALRRAITVAPGDPDPRLYYAIAAASTPGSRSVAIAQMKVFLQLHPNASELAVAHPWLVQLGLAS